MSEWTFWTDTRLGDFGCTSKKSNFVHIIFQLTPQKYTPVGLIRENIDSYKWLFNKKIAQQNYGNMP